MSTSYLDKKKQKLTPGKIGAWLFLGTILFLSLFPVFWMLRTALSPNANLFSSELNLFPEGMSLNNFKRILGFATLEESQAMGGSGAQLNFLLYLWNSIKFTGAIVIGTVSFAVRASFTKSGEKKAFRAQFKEGDDLEIQYLIVDKKPENALKSSQLPTVVITGPDGFKATMKINERTKFYEPYGGTNYFYLARYSGVAKAGIYNFVITSKAKAGITLGVGEKEIFGEVVRGEYVAPTP